MKMPDRFGLQRPLLVLILLAGVSAVAYGMIGWLGRQFVFGQGHEERPIVAVLGWFTLAFACYLAGLYVALRSKPSRRLLWLIVVAGVLYRAILLPANLIQEVDIYRYLWDGAVTSLAVNPYRYSPEQVLLQHPDEERPDDLDRLVKLRLASPPMSTVLGRIHFSELPTIYPPVSQAVFAMAAMLTPRDASVGQRLVTMKVCFLLFDLGTLALLVGLLRFTGRHVGWALAYGWCPLVMKEFANAGHLDSLAVFLTIAALSVLVRLLFRPNGAEGTTEARRATVMTSASAVLLALAVGAKLYPVVLLPLFVAGWIRRLGYRMAAVPTVGFVLLVAVLLWPMVPGNSDSAANARARPQDPSAGLAEFLRRWEMNDFLFMLVLENLKPHEETPPNERPWFSVAPEAWRASRLEAPAAFMATRLLTGGVFLAIASVLTWRAYRSREPVDWLRAAFLTLAWFWLLSPTQNPWYWIWALPLIPFARGKVWLVMSGLVMIYYLRFWLGYHWPAGSILGTGYSGERFFDYVVVWLEFGPWLAWLAVASWCRPASRLLKKGTGSEPRWMNHGKYA